ncbi:hypothetical protein D9M68_888600 [compost metagenome]
MACFFYIIIQIFYDPFYQSMRKSLLYGAFAPFFIAHNNFTLAFEGFGIFYKALGGIFATVEQHIFYKC